MDPVILFDQECPLCRFLAELIQKKSTKASSYTPWQVFLKDPPLFFQEKIPEDFQFTSIGVWINNELYEGPRAWQYILEHEPQLTSLNWAAEKLGLQKETAKLLHYGGRLAKSFCFHCPSFLNRVRRKER